MIKFNQEITLNIIEDFDEENDMITQECQETFKPGEIADADIYTFSDDGTVDLQFADGSVALSVPENCFEVID